MISEIFLLFYHHPDLHCLKTPEPDRHEMFRIRNIDGVSSPQRE